MATHASTSSTTCHVDDPLAGATSDEALSYTHPTPVEVCVICLDHISEKAAVLPCNHDQFDFGCVGTWIQQQRVCPLCKTAVKAIRYAPYGDGNPRSEVLHLPAPEASRSGLRHENPRQYGRGGRYAPYRPRRDGYRSRTSNGSTTDHSKEDSALEVRRRVYMNKTYSLHVGANRISKYRNITPSIIQSNPHLVVRAKAFIRRELGVFDFLNPSSPPSSSSGTPSRRASNAEFLLEYVISILKSIDLKASTGQAQELLTDLLGRENANLFIHELEAWLRSPYEKLTDWDRHVQYAGSAQEL